MWTVTFDELEGALAGGGAPVAAAEAHGTLCGALAVDAGYDAEQWLAAVLPDGAAAPAALRSRHLLETAYSETREALAGDEMEFRPLLPADEAPLEQRVAALAAWCAGFLYGLGSGLGPAAGVPEAVSEVVHDFGEISRATVGGEEPEESNEESYAEVVEYLRASTQLVYDELVAHRAGDSDR